MQVNGRKKLNQILNMIMCTSLGIFIGRAVFVVQDFKTHPGLYAMQSAPWYTSILVYGIFTLVVWAICILLKIIIKFSTKNSMSDK